MSAYVAKKVGRRIAGNRLAGQEVADPHFGASAPLWLTTVLP